MTRTTRCNLAKVWKPRGDDRKCRASDVADRALN